MTRSASTAIYLVRAENGLTKIGIAVSPRRLVSLRVDSPIPLELIHMAVIAYSGDRHPVLLGLAPEDRDTIREAARMVGMSMAQFIIRQGLIAAEEKLRKNP